MKERYTGQKEAQQEKTNVHDFEAARQERSAAGKPQPPPRPQEGKEEFDALKTFLYYRNKKPRTWSTREEMDKRNAQRGAPPITDQVWEHTEKYSREQDAKYEAWKQERDEARAKAGFHPQPDAYWERLGQLSANDFPPDQVEEFTRWVEKQNGENAKRREKERLEKEQAHEGMLKAFKKVHEERAKMTPEEKEAEKKQQEQIHKDFEHFLSPQGRREYSAKMVGLWKSMGLIPPDIDHLWLNLPSGWAEYREGPGNNRQDGLSYTMTLGTEPTDEQWSEYQADLQPKMNAWKAEKARREAVKLHAGDPRYDPMTGDLLKPDEHPLDGSSEYTFDGKTRPRRFVPPDSPYINNGYKPVQTTGEDTPESESKERLVKRLLKAGFVEVEPTLMDKASFEKVQWYRSLSPSEKLAYLQAWHAEMSVDNQSDKTPSFAKGFWELVGELIEDILRFTAEEMARLTRPPEQGKST